MNPTSSADQTGSRGEGSDDPAAQAQAIRDQIRNIRRPLDRSTRRTP